MSLNELPPPRIDELRRVRIYEHITYRNDVLIPSHFSHKHQLDVYAPLDEEKAILGIVHFIHGGGYKRGDKQWKASVQGFENLYGNVGETLAQQGFITVVQSYRLCSMSNNHILLLSACIAAILTAILSVLIVLMLSVGLASAWRSLKMSCFLFVLVWTGAFLVLKFAIVHEGDENTTFAEQIDDVAHALFWTWRNASLFGADPNSLFVSGHSAGGHLAALIVLDETHLAKVDAKEAPILLASIRGVALVSGVYNLGRLNKIGLLSQLFYIHPSFRPNTKETRYRFSPLTYAHNAASLPSCRFLLLSAAIDFHLPRDADELAEAMRKAGASAERVTLKGTTHQSIITNMGGRMKRGRRLIPDAGKDTTSPVLFDFFNRCLQS